MTAKIDEGVESLRKAIGLEKDLKKANSEKLDRIKTEYRKAAKIKFLKRHRLDAESDKNIDQDLKKKFSTLK